MVKLRVFVILLLVSKALFAQDTATAVIKALSDAKQYSVIIGKYANRTKELSAKGLYYVGLAYYMKEDDRNCTRFMDLSIAKNAKDPAPFYIKGSTLNYQGKYQAAILEFNRALALNTGDADCLTGLGDSYYNLKKFDKALEYYQKATAQQNPPDRPFLMIPLIYSELKDDAKALAAFYVARSKLLSGTDAYINALFNIGLLESLSQNYDKAEQAFLELIKLSPEDYHSYAKLIQIYYHRKDYEKAAPLKKKLYEAYAQGVLKGNLADMFCVDQFKWNGKLVQAYERFESGPKKDIYYKHLFYLVGDDGKIELRVQTEYSPISVENGGPAYLLCATKAGTHYNPGIGLNESIGYDDLKASAVKLLERYGK